MVAPIFLRIMSFLVISILWDADRILIFTSDLNSHPNIAEFLINFDFDIDAASIEVHTVSQANQIDKILR